MTSVFIPVANAIAANLVAPNPPKEYSSAPPKSEKYTRTYFQYNFGTPEKAFLSEPIFELTKTKANIKKKIKDGKVTWKLNLTLRDQSDVNGCMQLDLGVRNAVFKYKGQFKQFSFTVENPGNLNGTFFYSRTPEGQIIDGTNPIMSFKFDDKTLFKKLIFVFDESGAPIMDPTTGLPRYTEEAVDYKLLENMSFECGLTFSVRDLYQTGGAMPLPQLFARTCWILSPPSQRGEVDSKQSTVLKSFLQGANSEELTTLMAVIDKLKLGQASSLLESLKGGQAASGQGYPQLPAPSAGGSYAPPVNGSFAPPAGQLALPAPSAGGSYAPQGSGSYAPPASGQGYPQLPAPGSAPQQQQKSPTIDLTAYMNPQQMSAQGPPSAGGSYAPQAGHPSPQGYPQQMTGQAPQAYPQQMTGQAYPQQMSGQAAPQGYPQQMGVDINQYLQAGMAGQPQVSVARI